MNISFTTINSKTTSKYLFFTPWDRPQYKEKRNLNTHHVSSSSSRIPSQITDFQFHIQFSNFYELF